MLQARRTGGKGEKREMKGKCELLVSGMQCCCMTGGESVAVARVA